jgi:hypothetical protein
MTSSEAIALIREKEGKLCGRIYRRADGTILTTDCQPPAPRSLSSWQLSMRSLVAIVTGCAAFLGVERLLPRDWYLPPPKASARPSAPLAPLPVDDGWEGGAVDIGDDWIEPPDDGEQTGAL